MRRVANADAAHDVDRLFIIAHFEKFEMRNVPIPNYLRKDCLCRTSLRVITLSLDCRAVAVATDEAAEDRRFFKRDMKFSMEAN